MSQPKDYSDDTDPYFRQLIPDPERTAMSEPKSNGFRTLTWAIAVTLSGACITWGTMQARLSATEKRVEETRNEQRHTAQQVQSHETQIAVVKSQLDTILTTVKSIDSKIEHQERRRNE